MDAPARSAETGDDPKPVVAGRRARRHAERARRRPSPTGIVLRAALLLVGLIVLWPATWGGFTGLTIVQGSSMVPTYESGDLVVTLRQPSYGVGDVVSYVIPEGQDGAGGRVIHRIVAQDDSGTHPVFTTRGDNNPTPDVWRIGAADVGGRAVFHLPGIGRLLGGQTYPVAVGAAAALIALTLLWPRKRPPTA